MQKRTVFGLFLAASFVIAGCNSPMPSGVGAQTGQTATTDRRAATAEALATEQEMDDYDTLAGQSAGAGRYEVFAVGGPKARDGEVAITATTSGEAKTDKVTTAQTKREAFKAKLEAKISAKLKERAEKKAEKAKKRFDKMKDAADKIKDKARNVAWVDNGDGTETQSYKFETTQTVNGKTTGRSVEMTRTRNKETKDLVSSEVKTSMAMANGMSKSSVRTKTLNADGSYTVVFHSEMTYQDGTKRVADWNKTIGVEGGVTGTGTIVWTDKDGKEVKKTTITLGGTDDEPAADADGEKVTPAEPEASPSPDASASPSASPEASPSPEASASPAASPSPEASASPAADVAATAEADATAAN